MSKRNLAWLAAVVTAGAVGWIAFGIIWALVAAGATLVVSEIVERRARAQRRRSEPDAGHAVGGS